MNDVGGMQLLYETLQAASSQNPELLKPAEAKLAGWETQPGFYAALVNIIARHDFNMNARFIAAIHLKNGIEKHWKRVPNPPHGTYTIIGIPEAERITIKSSLEQLALNEPELHVATQLALVTAKIARLEIREWPTLLPSLMSSIQIEDTGKQHRALLVSYHVIKILSTKRLTGDRKIFQDIAVEIFDYLFGLWDRLYIEWATSGMPGNGLPRAHFALKILRILCVRGYKVPDENESVKNFMYRIMQRAKETLQLRLSRQDCSVLLEKHVLNMFKVVADLLEVHPFAFVTFLQSGLEFGAYFGFSEEGRSLVFEKIAIHSLNLIKAVILCQEYRAPRSLDSGDTGHRRGSFGVATPETNPLTYKAAEIKDKFFTNENLTILVRVLVTQYLPLSQEELDSWAEDPEEFALRMEDGGETWKYNLRQCAETLLVTLFKEFRKSTEVLLALVKEFEAPLKDPQDRPMILAKDALYNTIGITAYELFDEMNFDAWLSSTLVEELKLPVPILHRRITWLVGQWTGVKINAETRPAIYSILLCGLKSPDVVVRLTSSQSLRSCLDDFDFSPEQYQPFMDESFHNLFTLLQHVKESDSKMRVLHTMSFLIERMGAFIKGSNIIQSLSQYLPVLWATNHNMLKAAVVSTSIQIVHALGTDSSALREFLFPVIRISTDLTGPEHVYLLEDGLDLWLALMEYTTEPPDQSFLALADLILPLLSISTENLKLSISVVNSYALIYPEYFVEKYGSAICAELNSSVGDLRAEGVALVLRVVETFLRTSPINGPNAIKPIVGKILLGCYEAVDTPFLLALFFSVAARLVLISESVLQYGLEYVSSKEGKPPNEVLGVITENLCKKILNFVQPERRKLMCISLLKLMSACQPIILHQICGVFLAVSETLSDIMKSDLAGNCSDSLYVTDFETPREGDESATENDKRKKRVASKDVVYTVDLQNLFRIEVANLRLRLGEAGFNDAMNTVDAETLQLAKQFLE